MSDYLWDKTGERDPEVERLEGMLGGMRFEPGKLELPPAATPRTERARFGPFAWGALAAALALAGAVGLMVVSRDASSDATHPVATSAGGSGIQTDEARREAVTRAPEANELSVGPGTVTPKHLAPGAASKGLRAAAAPRPAAARREGRGLTATRVNAGAIAPSSGEQTVAGAAPAHDARRGAEAKEQLIYALRLTSAKLEEVRRRTRGDAEADDAGAPRARTR